MVPKFLKSGLSWNKRRFQCKTVYNPYISNQCLEEVFLWTALIRVTLLFSLELDIKHQSRFNCKLHEWVASISGSFSICILVVLTVERMVHTKLPVFAKVHLTRKNAKKVVAVIVVLLTLVFVHLPFGLELVSVWEVRMNGSVPTNVSSVTCTFATEAYSRFYKNVYTVFNLVILNVIPILIVVSGNFTIAYGILSRRRKKKHAMLSRQLGNSNRHVIAAKMLFVLSAVFLITTLPYFVYTLILNKISVLSNERQVANMKLVQAFVYNIFAVNFTFNFFLYFGSGTVFKLETRRMLRDIRTSLVGEKEDFSAVNIPLNEHTVNRLDTLSTVTENKSER